MAAATQILAGKAIIDGISGSFTFTNLVSGTQGANFESIDVEDNYDVEKISSQNGAVTETIIAKNRRRRMTGKFAPKGATRTEAKAALAAILAFGPLSVVTTSGFDVAALNGTWNIMPPTKPTFTREGYCIVDIVMEAQEDPATAGTFAGLAIAT